VDTPNDIAQVLSGIARTLRDGKPPYAVPFRYKKALRDLADAREDRTPERSTRFGRAAVALGPALRAADANAALSGTKRTLGIDMLMEQWRRICASGPAPLPQPQLHQKYEHTYVAVGGETMRVRIANVEQDARDPRGEVLLYDFRVIAPDGAEEPLCRPDPDGRRLGLPLAGVSDAAGILRAGAGNEFELVCTAGARGKCVRFGYAPWRAAPDGRPMLDWYNACVRMMRGDYCGDGRPFTRDGTIIDISDRIGVQQSDDDPSFRFEAAWGPDGALCVAHPRIPEIIDLEGLARACPRLAGKLGPAACNENAPGGLLINRSR